MQTNGKTRNTTKGGLRCRSKKSKKKSKKKKSKLVSTCSQANRGNRGVLQGATGKDVAFTVVADMSQQEGDRFF